MEKIVLDTLDKRIERLAEQIGDLMDEYRGMVEKGKLPEIELQAITKV